ncbi:MAG: bacterial Ig-like domain-containing protein [Bacteroidales bacterium]|nr:bacterial Ig-like domain-containing protein [Candidatus Sodaliphilus fimicaballi]
MKKLLTFLMFFLLATIAAQAETLFHETFGDNSGSARAWENTYSVKSGVNDVYKDITGYTVSNAKQTKNTVGSTASGLSQTTAGTDAYITIGPLNLSNCTDMELSYQWKAASTKGTYTTKAYYATSSTGSYTEITGGTGSGATNFVERKYNIPTAAQVSTAYIKIVWNTSNTQGVIDEVDLQGTITSPDPEPEKTLIGIEATGTPAEFWKGDAFNHNGITVTATWEDETETDVTSFCEFSGYDMNTAGVQTVTVTYLEETAQYNIEVKTIANTQETAYTVAKAKELIDAGKDLETKVYVKGTVSKVDKFNEQYSSITYWLDDNTFEVYSGKNLNNTDFNSVDDLAVGDEVIIYGIIKKFTSTGKPDVYEFDKNNYLVSLIKPVVTKYNVTIGNIEHGTVTASVAEAAAGSEVTLTATPADGYKFGDWDVKDANNNVITVNNNAFTMPAANVIVSATFEAKENYEIAWFVNGAELEDETKEYVEGSSITAPENPKNIADYRFVGWSKNKREDVSNDDIVNIETETVTKPAIYYAVFAKVTSGNKTEITDVITLETTGKESGAGYSVWSNKKVNSDAIYAGYSAGGNNSIQIRTQNGNSGIYTTQSGGYLKKISVIFESHTTDARTLNVYGNTIPYTNANELYSGDTDGDKLGSFKYIKNEEKEYTLDIEPNTYTHVGFKSNNDAMYISSISITWVTGTPDTYSDYTTTVNVQEREFYLNHTWGGIEAWWNKLTPTGDGTYSLNAVCGDSYNDITVGSNYKQAQQSRYLKEEEVIPTDQWDLESINPVGNVTADEPCTFTYNPEGNELSIVAKDITYYVYNDWKGEGYTWRPLNRANPDGSYSTTGAFTTTVGIIVSTEIPAEGETVNTLAESIDADGAGVWVSSTKTPENTYTYYPSTKKLTIIQNAIVTGIEDVEVAGSAVKAYKVIENGQVIIVRGNQRFNIMGQPVR